MSLRNLATAAVIAAQLRGPAQGAAIVVELATLDETGPIAGFFEQKELKAGSVRAAPTDGPVPPVAVQLYQSFCICAARGMIVFRGAFTMSMKRASSSGLA